jgi:hypothetical protein
MPEDWMGIAKACLSPGEYLLWKTIYTELCGKQAARNAAHGVPITLDMLLGKGPFEGVFNQLQFPIQAYQQIAIAAIRTWRELPAKGDKSQEITKILQGPDEPFQDFVARLMQAVGRTVADHEAGTMLVQQLAFENANKYHREAFHPHKRKVSI